MMRLPIFLATALAFASPAMAGVDEVLDDHVLPGLAAFSAASADLAAAAEADCTAESLAAPYNAAFDAWLRIGDIRMGPSETDAMSIAFWPDARGFTEKTLAGLIRSENPVVESPDDFAEISIAGRGLFALERLLFDPEYDGYSADSYSCDLAQALSTDLARQANALEAAWRDDFAPVLRSAGGEGNAAFLSEQEALQAVYTQILSSLEFTADTRIGRPMGTFERPRPNRAEARLSGRSLRNVVLATEAAVDLADALADHELPLTHDALAQVQEAATKIDDPTFGGVEDPMARFKVEVLQQKVDGVKEAVQQEIGVELGLSAGFNSQDGD